jgi:hypothetical protein
LPGKSLVVYEPAPGLVTDVFPCEAGHAPERSLLGAVLATVAADDRWIADRHLVVAGGKWTIWQAKNEQFRPHSLSIPSLR